MRKSLIDLGYPPDAPQMRIDGIASFCAAFQRTAQRFPGALAMRTIDDEIRLTWSEVNNRVRRVAGSLAALGLGPGGTVAFAMGNRPEHQIADLAALHLGAAGMSVYQSLPPVDIAYNVGDTGSRIVVTDPSMEEAVRRAVLEHGLKVDHLVVLDRPSVEPLERVSVHTAADFEQLTPPADFDFEASWRAVTGGDVAVVIYTSGTTGFPKGVELTHHNLLVLADGFAEVAPLPAGRRMLSAMPLAHMGERTFSFYLWALQGHAITFCPDLRKLNELYLDIRPAILFFPPRSLERFKVRIDQAVEHEPDPLRRAQMQRAIQLGISVAQFQQRGEQAPPELVAEWEALTDVRRSLLEVCGLDGIEYCVVGGAYVPVDLMEYFIGLGLPAREGYGLSECSGSLAPGRLSDDYRIGYAGPPASDVEVRLAGDGEILARGPRVMKGYRNQPEATAAAIDEEGWLHTGDIGTVNDIGQIKIIGRKQEIIINSNGKNMSPGRIETRIKVAGQLIGILIAVGEARDFVSALVVPDDDGVAAYRRRHGIPDSVTLAELTEDADFRAAVQAQIDRGNKTLSAVERVRNWTFVTDDWRPGGEELTATNKLRRRSVLSKYAARIEEMYQ